MMICHHFYTILRMLEHLGTLQEKGNHVKIHGLYDLILGCKSHESLVLGILRLEMLNFSGKFVGP